MKVVDLGFESMSNSLRLMNTGSLADVLADGSASGRQWLTLLQWRQAWSSRQSASASQRASMGTMARLQYVRPGQSSSLGQSFGQDIMVFTLAGRCCGRRKRGSELLVCRHARAWRTLMSKFWFFSLLCAWVGSKSLTCRHDQLLSAHSIVAR